MYKVCRTCGENLPLTSFWKDAKQPDGRKIHCGKCSAQKRGRKITPEHLRKRKTIRGLSPDGMTLVDKLDYVRQSKQGKGCHCCGTEAHPAAMDYHHLDESTKSFTIASLRQKKTADVTLEAIKNEIDKCVLLCAICHRLIHANALELLPINNVIR